MRHGTAVLTPSRLTRPASGSTNKELLIPSARRLASHARALAASDHLALRLAASAVLVVGLVLAVWWAVGVFSDL
jgi:hypothetical protein